MQTKLNSKIKIAICMLLLPIMCIAQTKTKQQTLKFISYSCGDLCHYEFIDVKTNKNVNFNSDDFEDNRNFKCIEEIDTKCENGTDKCPLKGQKYSVMLQYKLAPIYDIGEDGYTQTNKKEYKWVIVKMEKIINSQTNSNTKTNLDFIKEFKGKYPMYINLLAKEPLNTRLKNLLGINYSRFTQNFQTQTPIETKDYIYFVKGCKEHSCVFNESILCIDVKNNLIYVGIINDGVLEIFSENKSKIPEMLQTWADGFGIQSANGSFKIGYYGNIDHIDGCSCFFALNEKDYNDRNYIYSDDRESNAYISVSDNIIKLKFKEQTINKTTVKTAINNDYKVVITLFESDVINSEESESTIYNKGTIEITNIHTQDKIIRKIYGVCGC